MGLLPRRTPRHPFFDTWKTTPAAKAAGPCVAIIGTLDELAQAAERRVAPTHAVFPMLPLAGPQLPAADRDRLWNLFEVPVYAVVQDPAGRIVAFECETQDSLHFNGCEPPAGAIESAPCECGRPGARWLPARRDASSAA